MTATGSWSGTTLRWLGPLLATLSAACTPAQEACLQVGSAVTAVEGVHASDYREGIEGHTVTIGGGPYLVTLLNNDLSSVRVTNIEEGPAWLFVDQPGMILQVNTSSESISLTGTGAPNESCPERIAESFLLEFPGANDGISDHQADIVFNPPVDSFTVWIALIPAE